MAIREFIRKSPGVAGTAAVVVVILAIVFSVIGVRHANPPPASFPTRAFYTTDDGATLFEDDAALVPPFDHDGKQAVRAHVYSNGKLQWVQYLEKNKAQAPSGADGSQAATVLVKKPGPSDWVVRGGPGTLEVIVPKSPDGSDPSTIQPVFPTP